MTGLELIAGYLAAYAIRKARRAGKRVDAEVDYVVDRTLDRLHEVVSERLGDDPAIRKLQREAEETGAISPRTAQRVTLAIEDATEADDEFSDRLRVVLRELASRDEDRLATSVLVQSAAAGIGSSVNQAGRDIVHYRGWPQG
jgi:hypothetical protein